MPTLRPVIVLTGGWMNNRWEATGSFLATWHAWSTESDGNESLPVAIVEAANGEVSCQCAERIRFLDLEVKGAK